jgi:MFS family permease
MARGGLGAAFWWYLSAQVVSLGGTMMGYTALFWLGLHVRHGGGPALAGIDGAMTLPMLLLSRPVGALVSRYRAGRILVATQSLQAVGMAVIGVLLLAGAVTLWDLLPICFLIGAVQCVDLPARQSFMLELTGDDALRKGTSQYAAATGLGKIAGPAVGGLVLAVSGETAVFFIDALSFGGVVAVLAILTRTRMRTTVSEARVTPPSTMITARKGGWGWGWVGELPVGVRWAALVAALVGGLGWQFAVLNPLMAKDVLHVGAGGFGLFGTCAAVGGVLGSLYSSRRKNPGSYEFMAWSLVFGLTECVAAVMPVAWAYDLTLAAVGAALQLFAVSSTVFVQRSTTGAERGYALSAYNSAYVGFVPAGAFAVVAIAGVTSARWALIVPGLAIAVTSAALIARQLISRGTAPGSRQAAGTAGIPVTEEVQALEG